MDENEKTFAEENEVVKPDAPAVEAESSGTSNEEAKTEKTKEKHPFIQDVFDIVDAVVVAVVAAIFILTLVVRTGYVDGTSMLPTMEDADRYIVSGLFYTPKQGDIIVFQPDRQTANSHLGGDNKLLVKRVIATAGQVVSIDEETHEVLIDGVVLNEPYLTGAITFKSNGSSVSYPLTVGDGEVFVLGDNRLVSKDSRVIGCIDVRSILGRVILRFFPFDKMGVVN